MSSAIDPQNRDPAKPFNERYERFIELLVEGDRSLLGTTVTCPQERSQHQRTPYAYLDNTTRQMRPIWPVWAAMCAGSLAKMKACRFSSPHNPAVMVILAFVY